MYVKLLDGRFAGEVKELEPGAALDLIAVGRAERAFQEPAPEVPAIFAAGGVIEGGGGLVGEHTTDCFIPHETGEKLAKKKKTR